MILACPSCSTLNRIDPAKIADKPNCGRCKQSLFQGKAIELTADNFMNQVQKSELPVVIDFWASWCGPCLSFAPVFSQAAAELEPRFRFAKVNTEQQQQLAAQFQIRSIPTLMVFKQGKQVAQQSGAMPKQMFYQWLQQHS